MLECLERESKASLEKLESTDRQTLNAADGTAVSIITEQGREKITVHSNKGEIIFEYQPETKKCHFYVPEGDLHFNAPAGSVSLSSGRDINLKCPGDIIMEGQNSVKLCAGISARSNAALILDQEQAKLKGSKIAMQAEEGDFTIRKTRIRSRSFAAKINQARATLDHFEILAETMQQKTKNFYQQVDNLLQINAGRMRTFVQGLFHLKGERTYLKSEKDMKLKGDKIHLR